MSALDILKERGFIKQLSHEEEIAGLLEKEKITFYIGFDPTADSLHIGHFIALMSMAHMQKAGHRPICLLGGGTAMVGDPSGKDNMRRIMSKEEINRNAGCFKKQMAKFIDFENGRAIMENNAEWLLDLNYINFLREVGVHFSVNRMLSAECFKQRMEKGLSFFEFNYMLMQAYDFLELYRRYGCVLQMGGDDQWSNLLAGVELIRKKESAGAFCLTSKLLTTSEGKKMGKTEKGALWLDAEKTSPYDFYQYWRNIDDADVMECLALLTWLPMDEVRRLGALRDKEINCAKKILAFEVTSLVHGAPEAKKAAGAAEALFGAGGGLENVPTVFIAKQQREGKIADVLAAAGITASKGEARRLIAGGGLYVGEEKITDQEAVFIPAMFDGDGSLLLRKGKKTYHRIIVK
ncbi:MAG: tyrosine--tRNA ligase [Acidaminococcales bacterium]|nr:tyrosine--tRNA ligase [Acidaminococcales bacterium]